MIQYKSPREIEIMKEGGALLHSIFSDIEPYVREGVTTREIDDVVRSLMKKAGGTPSFLTVPGYKDAICIPINEQAVHTPPSNRVIHKGDVVTVDIGLLYKGLHTDSADTYYVGEKPEDSVVTFLEVGRKTLKKAIQAAVIDGYVGDISLVIQNEMKQAGYHIIPELTGHGVGYELHEDPYVPGYIRGPVHRTARLKEGMTLAIEIIYCEKKSKILLESDKWSYRTQNRSLAACFENTIAITNNGTLILT